MKYCYSYRRGTSTVDMARHHSWKRIILRFDLKNFFWNISPEHFELSIRQLLSERNIDLKKKINWDGAENIEQFIGKMVELCFKDGKLPVGAPSSPYISNIVGKYFIDNQIIQFLKINWYFNPSNDFKYTRYADDLIFSTNWKINKKILERWVSWILQMWKFSLNKKKTLIMHSWKRQAVLWLTVNGTKPTLPRMLIQRLRLCLHMLENIPLRIPEIVNNWNLEPDKRLFHFKEKTITESMFAYKILWYVSYYWMIDSEKMNALLWKYPGAIKELRTAIWARTETEKEVSL